MRRPIALVIACTANAHADTALEARANAEAERTYLDIDPVFAPQLEGLAGQHQIERKTYALDRKTLLTIELDQWANQDGVLPDMDVRGQGWKAGVRLTRDFGWVTVTLHGSISDVDTQFGFGRYRDLGVSVMHVVQRKAGKKLWFGLSFGQRKWLGEAAPPAGEADGKQAMLVLGWTF